jgi:hypothetical protein
MRFKDLSQLKRTELLKIELGSFPQHIFMTTYAKERAFKISELVGKIFEESFEWYGFTLAKEDHPELIIDIGLPQNDLNLQDYTALGSERIAEFQESLTEDLVINGWIHSHGALNYKHFSHTDEENNRNVLDFIAARTIKPLAKKEVGIQDMVLLQIDRFDKKDMKKGSVALITDQPIAEAKIMETVYGSFCYSIVIGDEGWHEQKIIYKERGILSGHTIVESKAVDIKFVATDRSLTQHDIDSLSNEVKKKIKPHTDPPPELIERM